MQTEALKAYIYQQVATPFAEVLENKFIGIKACLPIMQNSCNYILNRLYPEVDKIDKSYCCI